MSKALLLWQVGLIANVKLHFSSMLEDNKKNFSLPFDVRGKKNEKESSIDSPNISCENYLFWEKIKEQVRQTYSSIKEVVYKLLLGPMVRHYAL